MHPLTFEMTGTFSTLPLGQSPDQPEERNLSSVNTAHRKIHLLSKLSSSMIDLGRTAASVRVGFGIGGVHMH
jgi:hypothetical protein